MAGAIAYISRDTDGVLWKKVLEAGLGPIDFRRLDSLGDKADIEVALAWKPDAGLLASLPNLKLIVSLGMGVDHLLSDDKLPAGVPITRIMDDGLVGQMSEYALYWALRHHRDIDKYAASQRAKQWKVEDFVDTIHRRIGILGLGTIGQDTAKKFAALGFPTAGWSRTAKTLPGIETFHGKDGFAPPAGRRATSWSTCCRSRATRAASWMPRLFAALPKGAYFINMARGGHVVDDALLAALEFGSSERRRARRVQPGTLAGRASLLDASQGACDAAHRRRHQPAHGLARRDREHQAPAQRRRAAPSHRSEDGVLDRRVVADRLERSERRPVSLVDLMNMSPTGRRASPAQRDDGYLRQSASRSS